MRRMLTVILLIALVLAGLGLAVRLYIGRMSEDRLFAGEDVAIRQLRDPIPANAFLVCPPDYCAASATPSPVFMLPVEQLAQLWRRVLASEANVIIVTDEPAQHRLVAIQHTPLLRFPDIVTAEFVALGENRSSLAVYSHARYGRGDFGTNRKRVLAWLERLRSVAAQ